MKNSFIKILLSVPIILITLYLLPFLGIILSLVRLFTIPKKNFQFSFLLIILGVLIFVPNILYLLDVVEVCDVSASTNYTKIMDYGKFIITFGVILLLISYVVNKITNSAVKGIMSYLKKQDAIDEKVSKENDMKMKEKQYKMRNTKIVICPHCGADNAISKPGSRCKYCRRKLQ